MKNDKKSQNVDKLQKLHKFMLVFDIFLIVIALLTLNKTVHVYMLIALFIVFIIIKRYIDKLEKETLVAIKKEAKPSPKKKKK